MKSLTIASLFFSFSVFADISLEQLSVIDESALSEERGMYLIHDDQDNISNQGGFVVGGVKNSRTGNNTIQSNSFNGSHGIMMIHLGSGNNNVTNMNTNINVISVN